MRPNSPLSAFPPFERLQFDWVLILDHLPVNIWQICYGLTVRGTANALLGNQRGTRGQPLAIGFQKVRYFR